MLGNNLTSVRIDSLENTKLEPDLRSFSYHQRPDSVFGVTILRQVRSI